MSLTETKAQLIRLLGEVDNRVIALSGKWGTGKTHLWNEVRKESADDNVKNALYVSLFGLSSVDQIKRKLIEVAIPGAESHGGVFDGIKSIFSAGVKALSTHYKALAAINDLNVLLMAPVVFRKKVIVIDDIERKHEKLGIDEVLGFIDEYSKQYGSRFVLVLNDDQLSSKSDQEKLWATFREKVIDHEIRLLISADEAFSLAIKLVPSSHAVALKRAVITCGLTNIRIVGKVIRVANRILGSQILEDFIQARVVPSIVLFSAIHFRGLEDGPDLQFALSVGDPNPWGYGRDENMEPTEDERREDRWRLLMAELGIRGCDELELLLVEYLESGLFDAGKIENLINNYVAEKQILKARQAANNFLKKVFWDHRVNDEQLVAEAAELPSLSELLDPFTVTELDQVLSKLPGGGPIGQAIVDGWIEAFTALNSNEMNDENPLGRPVHAAIQAAFAANKAQRQANTSVIDACMYIIDNDGWGTLQTVAMSQATSNDFEAGIRGMQVDSLPRFMRRMIEMRLQRTTYDPHFGLATERFVEACNNIANDTDSPRLAGLIKRLFRGTSLESELVNQADATGQLSAPIT